MMSTSSWTFFEEISVASKQACSNTRCQTRHVKQHDESGQKLPADAGTTSTVQKELGREEGQRDMEQDLQRSVPPHAPSLGPSHALEMQPSGPACFDEMSLAGQGVFYSSAHE